MEAVTALVTTLMTSIFDGLTKLIAAMASQPVLLAMFAIPLAGFAVSQAARLFKSVRGKQ